MNMWVLQTLKTCNRHQKDERQGLRNRELRQKKGDSHLACEGDGTKKAGNAELGVAPGGTRWGKEKNLTAKGVSPVTKTKK